MGLLGRGRRGGPLGAGKLAGWGKMVGMTVPELVETVGVESQPGPFGMMVEIFGAGNVAVLSGAGLSTESGIPDYRGPSGQARGAGQPMTYQAFTGSAEARQRYWARSHLGWRHITGATPNPGHRAVATLERAGLVGGIITQNVDGLHQAAGASSVTELHGSLHRVVCLSCWERSARKELDARLRAANPGWARGFAGAGGAAGAGAGGRFGGWCFGGWRFGGWCFGVG